MSVAPMIRLSSSWVEASPDTMIDPVLILSLIQMIHHNAEKVIKGWDIGVATMNLGEIARFIITPEYAYGAQGFAPKVEPNETLDFEIELLKFKDPLPRFPTQAELAETRRKQAEEDKKALEENPPPTVGWLSQK